MAVRKIYCEVVEGAVYSDRCLFRLREVVESSETCKNCILRELEDIKRSLSEGKKVKKKKRKRGRDRRDGSEKDSGTSKMEDPEGSDVNGLQEDGITPNEVSEEKAEALRLSNKTQNDPEVRK